MALLIPPFLATAFERLGAQSKALDQVAANTKETAVSVSVGGDLYKKMDELVKALKSGGSGGGKVSIKEALVLRITAGALEPIGLGLGVIIDALERAPDGKELKLKMEALTNGLLALGDIGWSILKFAGLMILALPLLIIAGVAMLLIVPLIRLMVDGLMWATQKLDKKGLENIAALGDVGKALLILSASLVLMALLSPLILGGLLVAGLVLLGFGLLIMLLGKMKLDAKAMEQFSKSLLDLALGLFGISLTLILIGFLVKEIVAGLIVASLVLLTIGGIFWLLDKMQVDRSMKKTSKALLYAGAAILGISIALVLSHLILESIGFEEVAKVMLIVAGIALFFAFIGGAAGKNIKKGAQGLILAAVAIFLLGLAIIFMKYAMGDFKGEDVVKSFMVLAVIAGIGVVFGLLGNEDKLIKKGSIAMMLAGIAVVIIAYGVGKLKEALQGVTWEKMLMMGAVIAGVGLAFAIAGEGPNAGYIALGSAAMAAAGLALYILGGGVKEFQAGLKGVTWENLGMMAAIIVGVGAAFALAGIPIVAGFIALGSAAMMAAGAALYIVGRGIGEFNKLPIQDMMGSGRLFGDSGQVTKGFMGFGGGRKMTNMEVMFLAVADSFSLGALQIAAMYAGAPALESAGYALESVAIGLQQFQKITKATDLKTLGTNVGLVTTILIDAFAKAGNMLPRPKTIMGALLNAVSDQNPVTKGISSVSGMGNALTSIAMGFQQMANLRFPVAWDKNGKPIKFESMKSDAPAKVAANTKMIVDALVGVFADAGNLLPRPTTILGALLNAVSDQHPVTKGISAVSGMGNALKGIAMGFQSMADLRFPTKWDKNGKPIEFTTVDNIQATSKKVNDNVKEIITGLTATFSAIGAGEESSWFGSTDYEKGVNIANKLGTPLKNLAEGVVMMANLKFPTGFDKNGKATGYTDLSKMTPEELKQRVGTNTKNLILALTSTFVTIGGGTAADDEATESSWWQGDTAYEKGISIVNTLTKPYQALSETVKAVLGFIDKKIDSAKLKTIVEGLFAAVVAVGDLDGTKFWFGNGRMKAAGETYDDFGDNIKSAIPIIMKVDAKKFGEQITALLAAFTTAGGSTDPTVLNAAKLLTAAVGTTYEKMGNSIPNIVGATNKFNPYMGQMVSRLLFGQVDAGNAVAGYTAQYKMQLALATTYGKAGENFPKISSSINALDLTKLTESRKMFEALAVLSKGGSPGDILAQMGSSLEDALKNLATMLEKFKTTVKEGNESQGGILKEVGNAVTGVKNAVFGGGATKPGAKETPAKLPTKMTVDISPESIAALKKGSGLGGGNT